MMKKQEKDTKSRKNICAGKGERSQTKGEKEKKVEKRSRRKNRAFRIGVWKRAAPGRSTELRVGITNFALNLFNSFSKVSETL